MFVACSELAEVHSAVVRSEKVEKSLVVLRWHSEQLHQGSVVAAGRREPAFDELTQVMPGDIAVHEQRVRVIPE